MGVECAPQCAQWAKVLGDCVCNGADLVSVVLGLLSVVSMALCFLPQIILNWISQSSEGMSFILILVWTLGDLFNVAGVLLSKALPTQMYLAFLYSSVDVVLNCQHIYYNGFRKDSKLKAWWAQRFSGPQVVDVAFNTGDGAGNVEDGRAPPGFEVMTMAPPGSNALSSDEDHRPNLLPLGLILLSVSCIVPFSATATNMGVFRLPGASDYLASSFEGIDDLTSIGGQPSRVLLAANTKVVFGTVLGWGMAACFVMGRVPQLLQNFKRHTTDGLSSLMMVLLVYGNICYLLSIFIRGTAWSFLAPKLPWIVSSCGSLVLDALILGQVIYYGHRKRMVRRQALALQKAFSVDPPTASTLCEITMREHAA